MYGVCRWRTPRVVCERSGLGDTQSAHEKPELFGPSPDFVPPTALMPHNQRTPSVGSALAPTHSLLVLVSLQLVCSRRSRSERVLCILSSHVLLSSTMVEALRKPADDIFVPGATSLQPVARDCNAQTTQENCRKSTFRIREAIEADASSPPRCGDGARRHGLPPSAGHRAKALKEAFLARRGCS